MRLNRLASVIISGNVGAGGALIRPMVGRKEAGQDMVGSDQITE